ncbi:MAG: phosphopyruvate hydratase [Candidatus Diapherotrites archaeon]
MNKIKTVFARMVLDSRGHPTIEVSVDVGKGQGRAISPSGASSGTLEAQELRDGGKAFFGLNVTKAIHNVNALIAPKLKGLDAGKQKKIDDVLIQLDGTTIKSHLGANAIVATSMAVCAAESDAQGKPLYEIVAKMAGNKHYSLPVPMLNVINGGKHAGNPLPVQECLVIPKNARSFFDCLQIGTEIYHNLRSQVRDRFGKQSINVGDEGGFTPPLSHTEDALKLIELASKDLGYAKNLSIGLDVAANTFYKENAYQYEGKKFDNIPFVEYWESLLREHPIVSLEDPFAEEDWQAWCALHKGAPSLQLVGDDLLSTRVDRIQRAHKLGACNAVIIKPNQVGTVSEAIAAVSAARSAGMKVIASHRSGDSEDTFMADFAVGIGADFVKFGAPCRSERTAKYNRLLAIEAELGKKGSFGSK